MATRFLSRSVLTTVKQSLSSAFSRSFTSISLSASSFSLVRLRPLVAVAANIRHISPASSVRGFATRQTSSSLSDQNPNWSNRPPKETILLDGCDFEHWLVVMEKPEGDPTRDEIIDSYIKTLAQVIGSEDETRMKIYSVSTRHYYAFGALVSEELSYKIKELPRVRWVLPDSYLDVRNKDYGGEPFINGQAVPYDPKYHEEWVRNNARANERNRRNDRPRNFDRSRNFERRREMQNPGANVHGGPPGGPNMGGAPNMGPNSMGGPPNRGGMPSNNMGPPNMGGMPPNNMRGPPNMGGMPPGNMGGAPNMGGMPANNMGGQPPSFYNGGSPPPGNMGGMPNTAPNFPYGNAPNSGGMPHQSVPGSNPNYAPNGPGDNPYQHQKNSGGMPHQSVPGSNPNYAPNVPGDNPYQQQNMPGRDMPPHQNY